MDLLKVALEFATLLLICGRADATCHHAIVAPKGLRTDTPTDIYIDFHGCPDQVDIVANLFSYPTKNALHCTVRKTFFHEGRSQAITLAAVGEFRERNEAGFINKAMLDLRFCFPPNCGNREKVEITMPINDTRGYVFITTDRPAYRPGELVKIGLGSVNQAMLVEESPRSVHLLVKTPEEFGHIIVEDEEKHVDLNTGFLGDHDFKIPPDSIRGIWRLDAAVDGEVMATTSFVVDRYVLPTFDVKIHMDRHFILRTDKFINGTISAKYSYGEGVYGSYFLTMLLKRADGTEQEFYKLPSHFTQTASFSEVEPFKVPMDHITRILQDGETLETLVETEATVVVMASVTGWTESVFESDVVENVVFTQSPYEIDYSQSAKFFLTGTVYELRATIRSVVTGLPLSGVPVSITLDAVLSPRVSNADGNIFQPIDSFQDDVERIRIATTDPHLAAEHQSTVEFQVLRYAAEDGLQLEMRIMGAEDSHNDVYNVGENLFVLLDIGESAPSDIRLYVISRGEIVHADTKVIPAGRRGEVSIPITVKADMVPSARIVAYYVLNDKIIANSQWFDVRNECKDPITIEPEHKQVAPKELVLFNIEGPPNGNFLFKAVDRAAYFVHNDSRITPDTLWHKMEQYDTACSKKGGRDAINVLEEAGLGITSDIAPKREYKYMQCVQRRKRRSVKRAVVPNRMAERLERCATDGERENRYGLHCHERVRYIRDNLEALSEDGQFIEECTRNFFEACRRVRRYSYESGRSAEAKDSMNFVRNEPRKEFRENWAFTTRQFDADGHAVVQQNAPESITTYELDAFGMSSNAPICVAETKEVKVFKKFFIQLYLPYSVRVREQAIIRFSLFNYGEDPERVSVRIKHSEELCSGFRAGDYSKLTEMEVDGNAHSEAGYFTILPLKVPDGGKATIEIQAGNDAISKDLLIEETGQHNESSKSFVLETNPGNPDDVKTFDFSFDIPKESVLPDTKKCWIYTYAHPMGPSVEINEFDTNLNNLQDLVKVPAGCGEQNMIRIGPTVYIHRYRLAAYGDQVTEAQRSQATQYIKSAYTIELKWRSDRVNDRAFAVWNSHPPSTWLNAFVTKVFSAAKEYYREMATDPVCSALQWLMEEQNNEDGSFEESYKVHHRDMPGQVTDKVTLTAYVAISLTETQEICPGLKPVLEASALRAMDYVKANLHGAAGTSFALALGAYALAKTDPDGREARDWNERLHDSKAYDGEYIFWRGTRGRATDIETTAYALLAELALYGIKEHNDDFTRRIAHWLISNRNDKGGFVSTQDTVVALQALSEYMAILETSVSVAPPQTDMVVDFSSREENAWNAQPRTVRLTHGDSTGTVEVPPSVIASRHVTVDVHGVGTGSMAYRCSWRQFASVDECHFSVEATLEDDPAGPEEMKILKVTVKKEMGNPVGISIIDVGLLTGYTVVEQSIKDLSSENVVDGPVDRYELTKNTVKFYLSSLDAEGKKLAFKVRRDSVVKNIQPAAVSAYDYYEPDIRCTKFYTSEGSREIRLSCTESDEGDGELCKCAEGDCLRCRTREEQLVSTKCSNHDDHRLKCTTLCRPDSDCYDLHAITCRSDYVYIVRVEEVEKQSSTPGFAAFYANVTEVFRMTSVHLDALHDRVKFQMREDCFDACKDPRYEDIARRRAAKSGVAEEAKHYIDPEHILLVYGNEPTEEDSRGSRYTYTLDQDAGMEVVPDASKCFGATECAPNNAKCMRKKQNTKALCEIKSVLNEAHVWGCD